MLRVFALLSLIFISTYSHGQVNPWPWNVLAPKTEISSNGIHAMAVRQEQNKVIVIIFGVKPSPAYEATLTEMPDEILSKIIDHGEHNGPVLQFELKKRSGGKRSEGTYAPQVIVPFAVTKSINKDIKSLWIIFEKDEAILVNVTSNESPP